MNKNAKNNNKPNLPNQTLKKLPKIAAMVKEQNKRINKEKKEIKQIHKDINNMKIGSRKQNMSSYRPTTYLQSLLIPERVFQSRVPGMADSTVCIKRKTTYVVTAGALGAVGVFWQPNYLYDTTVAKSNFYVVANATYDGQTTIGASNAAAAVPSQAITPGSVGQYRLVSASMHVVPQASVLNQQGTIHTALIKFNQQTSGTAGSLNTNLNSVLLYPSFHNSLYYNAASVSNMEGSRAIWIPNDPCLLEFCNINTTISDLDGNNQGVNSIVAVIVGASSGQTFRIDLYQNYELIPAINSILQGMESISEYNEVPERVWRTVLKDHAHEVVYVGRAVSEVAAMQQSSLFDRDVQLGKQPTINNPFSLTNKYTILAS